MTRIVLALAASLALPAAAYAQRYPCGAELGTNCRVSIHDGWSTETGESKAGSATSSLLVLPGACPQEDRIVDVDLSVHVLHPYVGDLEIVLTHPDGTAVQVLYRPGIGAIDGNCPNDDVDVSFDDDDGVKGGGSCRATIPALHGSVLPFNPLSLLDGKARNGSWTLTLRDHHAGAEGVLLGWELELPCKPDLPDVTIDTTDAVVSERGPDDLAIVTVSRGGESAGALEVAYMVTGSASLADFETLPGRVEIPAGASSAAIEIRAIEDDLDEREESIIVTLLPAPDYEVGARQTAFVTLLERSDALAADGGGVGTSGRVAGESGRGGAGGRDDGDEEPGGDEAHDGGTTGGRGGAEEDDGCACRIAGSRRSELPALPLSIVASILGLRVWRRRAARR